MSVSAPVAPPGGSGRRLTAFLVPSPEQASSFGRDTPEQVVTPPENVSPAPVDEPRPPRQVARTASGEGDSPQPTAASGPGTGRTLAFYANASIGELDTRAPGVAEIAARASFARISAANPVPEMDSRAANIGYPESEHASRRRLTLRFAVATDAKGVVTDAVLMDVEHEGDPLAESALRSIRGMRFRPALALPSRFAMTVRYGVE